MKFKTVIREIRTISGCNAISIRLRSKYDKLFPGNAVLFWHRPLSISDEMIGDYIKMPGMSFEQCKDYNKTKVCFEI